MSDTDDTDTLLLIPPDFFLVDTDFEEPYVIQTYGPYYNIVDKLITQVNSLKSRINGIESTSTSLIYNALDFSLNDTVCNSNVMSEIRRFNSSEDIQKVTRSGCTESTQSTPQKPRTKFKLNSLPTTPNVKEGRLHACNRKDNKGFLGEIDNFISNVKTIQKISASKNLQDDFSACNNNGNTNDGASKQRLNLKDVDSLLKQLEHQEDDVDKNAEKRKAVEEYVIKQTIWQPGENKNSVPDYNTGMRDLMYDFGKNDNVKAVREESACTLERQVPSTSDLSTPHIDSYYDNRSRSSTDSTRTTAFHNSNHLASGDYNSPNSDLIQSKAMHVLNMHKNLSRKTETNPDVTGRSNEIPSVYSGQTEFGDGLARYSAPDCKNIGLLSLSELWGQNGDNHNWDRSRYLHKLEEEKLRRQHCEQLIQQLQTRALELQQRLAVAVQVDNRKDEAILRFHEAWEKIAVKFENLYKQKNVLDEELKVLRTKSSEELFEINKKISYYENEASKALTLAHCSQEKVTALEKHCEALTRNIQDRDCNKITTENDLKIAHEKHRQVAELLAQKESELYENKDILADARKEISQSKRAVEMCQAELVSMKTECSHLQAKLQEEQAHGKQLEVKRKNLAADLETHRKIEKTLQEELNKVKELSENNKLELRNFYQDQVEVVVRDKLREFQGQLDRAEGSLQEEVRSKELAVAKNAATHIQKLVEKHNLEILLLEEKHNEEVRYHKLQLSDSQQQITNLQGKIQKLNERRANIAQQLYKVMEAQWIEALKIINNGRSPMHRPDQVGNTADLLNSLKNTSYTNLEKLLLLNMKDEGKDDGNDRSFRSPKKVTSSGSASDDPIHEKNLQYLRPAPDETPVTSRPKKTKQQIELDLQKYVQMLLYKRPGHPTDEKQESFMPDQSLSTFWQAPIQDGGGKSSKVKEHRSKKPAWK